jgi:hypothetical protein
MDTWLIPPGCEEHPAIYLTVTVIAFFITAMSKGGFGGGIGVISIPMMIMVIPPKFALGMWLPLLVWCDILTMRHYPKEWELRPNLLLAPWMVAGIVIGYFLLGSISKETIKISIGGLALAFCGLELVRMWVRREVEEHQERPPWKPGWFSAAPFGLSAGVSTMIAHGAGPITTIYMLPQRMDRRTFVGTLARFYFVFNTLKVPFFILGGWITLETLRYSLWLVPLAPLFVWSGSALNKRISTQLFVQLIYVALALTGVYLVWSNLQGQ